MSERAYIAVGSNIDPEHNVAAALERLGRRQRILAVSTFYWTPALGAAGADAPAPAAPAADFLNGVVAIETWLEPAELKRSVLQEIENELGRRRGPDRHAPRTIDLDLVLQGERVVSSEELTLPSPEILERPFVGLPLLELEPDLVLPGSGPGAGPAAARPLRELVQGLSSNQMRPAEQFNQHLRSRE